MTTATVQSEVGKLTSQLAALEAEQQRLIGEHADLEGRIGNPEVARTRDSLLAKIREHADKRVHLRQELGRAEERAARVHYDEALRSPAYRDACLVALRSLDPLLGPWAPLFQLIHSERRLTPMPPAVALLALQLRGWVEPLLRHGVLRDGDIPAGLKPFMGVKR